MMQILNDVGSFFSKFPSLWPGTILAISILAVNGAYNHNTFASSDEFEALQQSIIIMQESQRINFLEAEVASIQREIFSLKRLNGEANERDKKRLDELQINLDRKLRELEGNED